MVDADKKNVSTRRSRRITHSKPRLSLITSFPNVSKLHHYRDSANQRDRRDVFSRPAPASSQQHTISPLSQLGRLGFGKCVP
jgi:hypothetical protein